MSLERRKQAGEPWETVEVSDSGGSLPDWWTVDSTPGLESFTLEHDGVDWDDTIVVNTGPLGDLNAGGVVLRMGPTALYDDHLFVIDAWGVVQIGSEFAMPDASPGLTVYDNTGTSTLTIGNNTIGFFGQAPAAQPTGVAVDAAGIHAALVTLGLITA